MHRRHGTHRTGPVQGAGRSSRDDRGAEHRGADVDADPVAVARAICLRLLTDAPRTRHQLAAALRRRDVPAEAAEAVLDRLTDVGLLDDAAFASAWVSSRQSGRGLAPRALGEELRRRGVDRSVVDEALASVEPDSVRATARSLVQRRLPQSAALPYAARMRRLTGMLARKGYPAGLALEVVREALGDAEPDGADG